MNKAIVFLHPHFLKPGGASKVVLEQASRLIEKNKKCIIVTTKINPEVTKPYPKVNIVELSGITTGSLFFWLTFPLFFRKLIYTLRKINSRIIYCHSLAIYWGYFYKKYFPKIKLIYYLHDLGLPYTDVNVEIAGLNSVKRFVLNIFLPILKLFNQNIILSANYIIANSITSAGYLYKKYGRKVNEIVFPGVDTNMFKPRGIKRDYIFTVGRLEKLKDIDKVIFGFAQYCVNNPASKTKLFIIGDGIEKSNLLRLTKQLNLSKHVFFMGQKSSKEISSIASKAKLGIFMCPFESFGLAVAESLSCGTPVIGVNANGVKEIISNQSVGEIVGESPASVSRALSKMLSKTYNLEIISRNSVNYAKKNLSWDIQVSKLNKFFDSI